MHATCVESSGIVRCFCPPGYGGSGVGPIGCQPGAPPSQGPIAPSSSPNPGLIVSPCASLPCQNGATCIPTASAFFCQCAPGFSGPTCSERENFCAVNPCMNGGTCTNLDAGFNCECASGFTGITCLEEVQFCGGTFDSPAGFIDFPVGSGTNYDHSISCDYNIQVEEGKVINITFSEFRLEGGRLCNYDWLSIYDGSSSSGAQSSLIGRFCGRTLPGDNGTLISSRNSVFLEFRSDHSVADQGFHLTWNTTDPVCGELITGQTRGRIMSPGFPGRYPHNADCTWTIIVDYGKKIQFHFAMLNIETHRTCDYDKLEIIEGSNPEHVIGTYCNSTDQVPAPITSSSHEVHLRFQSDQSASDTGFLITWAEKPGCGRLMTEVT